MKALTIALIAFAVASGAALAGGDDYDAANDAAASVEAGPAL